MTVCLNVDSESRRVEASVEPVKADKKNKKNKVEKVIPPTWQQMMAMTPPLMGLICAESMSGAGSIQVLSVETLGVMSKNILRNATSEISYKAAIISIAILGACVADKTLDSSTFTSLTTAVALKTLDREFNKGLKDVDSYKILGGGLVLSAGSMASSFLALPAPLIAAVADSLSTCVKHAYKKDPKITTALNITALTGAVIYDLHKGSWIASTVPIALSIKELVRKVESWQTGGEDVEDDDDEASIQEPAPLYLQLPATAFVGSLSYGLVFLAQKQALAILAIVGACLDKGFGRMIRNIVSLKFTPFESALLSIAMGASGKVLSNIDHFAVSGFGILTMALSLVVFQQAVKNWQLGKVPKMEITEPVLLK